MMDDEHARVYMCVHAGGISHMTCNPLRQTGDSTLSCPFPLFRKKVAGGTDIFFGVVALLCCFVGTYEQDVPAVVATKRGIEVLSFVASLVQQQQQTFFKLS